MQPAECVGHVTPVGLRLGRSAFHVSHHHETVRKQPSVRRRDRYWHGQTSRSRCCRNLVSRVAPGPETTYREVPSDTHAPYVVGYTTSEWFDASDAAICQTSDTAMELAGAGMGLRRPEPNHKRLLQAR